jgi:hypothetical protein
MKTLVEGLLSWTNHPASAAEMSRAGVVVTHEFGDQQHLGVSNAAIAEVAHALMRELSIRLWVAQYPTNFGARDILPIAVIRTNYTNPGAYLDTEEVNRQVASVCRERHVTQVVLVCHPHHAWRAKKNLERFGMTVYLPDLSSIPYDPGCSRKPLNSALYFIPREILARIFYYFKGYYKKVT